MKKGLNRQGIFAIGSLICLLACVSSANSQLLQTITDQKDILIGEQFKLTIKATIQPPATALVNWLQVPDSIRHFEVIEQSTIDSTTFKDDSKTYEQTLTITSFDSGRWVFPSLRIAVADPAGARIMQTDSFFVNVSFSPPDSTNQLRDIKPIIRVSVRDYFWYYVAGGALLMLLVAYLLYRYFKRRKPTGQFASTSTLSAFDEAMEELKKLANYSLQDAAETKMFHTRLADIYRHYLGRRQQKNFMNETTGDLLISIKNNMQPDEISKLATALRCTDAVKFARYQPMPDESTDCLKKIQEAIQVNEQQTMNKD